MATGHLEKRYKSSWIIVIDKGRDENGERDRIRISFKGPRPEAKAEMLRMINEVEQGTFVKPIKTTVKELLTQWLEDHRSQLAPRTYESYEMICRVHLTPALGAIRLEDLKPISISKYKTDKLKAELAPRTVAYHLTVLHEALEFAIKMQMLRFNPVKAVDKPKIEKQKFAMPRLEDIAKLLEVAKEYNDYSLIFTALYTGMRLGEVLALHWEDVDLDNRIIQIRRKVQRVKKEEGSELVFSEPKAHSTGSIDISAQLVELLRSIKAEKAKGLVFPTKNNTPHEVKNVSARFRKIAAKAGLDMTFHGLRHTHASLLLNDGQPLATVQERLRHKQSSITSDIYGHVMPSSPRQVADRFEQIMQVSKKDEPENNEQGP